MAITKAPATVDADFPELMKQARLDAGYPRQEDAAPDLGVKQQTVSKWETGGVPATELWPKIEEVYGLDRATIYMWLEVTGHLSARSSASIQTLADLAFRTTPNHLTPLAA